MLSNYYREYVFEQAANAPHTLKKGDVPVGKPRKVSQKSLRNLNGGISRWNHPPTKAVRIPERFVGILEDVAKALDGQDVDGEAIAAALINLAPEPFISALSVVIASPRQPVKEQPEPIADPLIAAILFLASRCDGALAEDGRGFNGGDAKFGKYLAELIKSNKMLRHHARSAHKMVQKYAKSQLAPVGIVVPEWESIKDFYPEFVDREVSPKRIELNGGRLRITSPYDPDTTPKRIAALKAMEPRARYGGPNDPTAWYAELSQLEEVIKICPDFELDPEIEFAKLEAERAQAEAEAEELRLAEVKAGELLELAKIADEPLTNGWKLFDHQKQAVTWLLQHRKDFGKLRGGILSDEMGLGKTLSALVAAKALYREFGYTIFVICPATLKDNWLREADKVGVAIEVYSWAKQPKPLESQKYVVIADESHAMQSLSSVRTKNAIALAKHENCKAAWLLTATPMKNGRPVNLFPLLVAVNHPLSASKHTFEEHYCNAHRRQVTATRSIWDVNGAAHLKELSDKTSDAILQRKKTDCLDLPPKIRSLVPVEVSSADEQQYQQRISELVRLYKERVDSGEISSEGEALVTLGQLRLAGSEAKVNAAVEMAQDLLNQGHPVVLFTAYKESARLLHKALGGELLTGETPTSERQAIIDRFQNGESDVFIGTIQAGGVGITLTRSSHIFLVDRPWTPGDAAQCEDRCHRIGTTQTVSAFWLQYGQVDLAIDQLLEQKQANIELVMKGKKRTLKAKSMTELAKELLEIL
ncbi:MAG: DEAD/DEAH box helicase [Desertifilum sp.]|nr:DEAD/DEAH box helicase [Desertifilum sp.]